MATALHPCAAAVALSPRGDHCAFSPFSASSYSPSDSARASLRRVEAATTVVGLRSHSPQCSLRQHSLSSPCSPPPSSALSLDSKRQDVFSGSFSRRSLLAHVPSPDALPSCSSRPAQRGGCGAARMNYSSFSDDRAYENDEYIEAHVIEAGESRTTPAFLSCKDASFSPARLSHPFLPPALSCASWRAVACQGVLGSPSHPAGKPRVDLWACKGVEGVGEDMVHAPSVRLEELLAEQACGTWPACLGLVFFPAPILPPLLEDGSRKVTAA